jgi:hypothetical protein
MFECFYLSCQKIKNISVKDEGSVFSLYVI